MPLDHQEPWRYFGADEATALLALRAAMGASYAAEPDDDTLSGWLNLAVDRLETYTGRFFVPRTGRLDIDGNTYKILQLPYPVVSDDQIDGATVEVVIGRDLDAEPIDPANYHANAGAMRGPTDPRNNPNLSLYEAPASDVGSPVTYWPYGIQNIHVTATWGYLEPDGTTPRLIRQVLARLCIFYSAPNDEEDAVADRTRMGGLISESVRDRSYSYGDAFLSAGLTGDREIDIILQQYRRPPDIRQSISPARKRKFSGQNW